MNNQDGVNRGKDFELVIRDAFQSTPNTTIERMPDPVMGYLGIRNKCDYIMYHFPFQYYLECKTVQSHRLPMNNVTFNQRTGMLEVAEKDGVIAGIICWFIPEDKTLFIPIQTFEKYRLAGEKSINIRKMQDDTFIEIHGKKKRVFYDYDMGEFINTCCARKLAERREKYGLNMEKRGRKRPITQS